VTINEGYPSGILSRTEAWMTKKDAITNDSSEMVPPTIVAIRSGMTEKPVASFSHTRIDRHKL